jgi:hypothetical protein
MMVQTAPEREPHFISTMREHLELCGILGRAFGNDQFERLSPFDEVIYVIDNHDRGWDYYDTRPGLDSDMHLPYLMSKTPVPASVKTNKGSPDFNETHHPYCGLISSMHSWGLYNRRYGFTQFVVRTRQSTSITVQDAFRPLRDAMLAGELERQQRLKKQLAENPATSGWLAENHVFQNYKQLTFIDTLSLYFHLYHAGERGEETFIHVPKSAEEDSTVTVKKLADDRYSLDPFPFRESLKLTCRGRYAMPFPADFNEEGLGAALAALPTDRQTYHLVPE